MTDLNIADQIALETVRVMIHQIKRGHPRADHIRADIQAYVSERAAGSDGRARGDFLTAAYWLFPQFVDYQPVADVLKVTPDALRWAVGN
jgi:hypothetical protein